MPLIPFEPPPGLVGNEHTFTAQGQWSQSDGFRFYRGYAEAIGGAAEMTSATAVDRVTKMITFDASGTINLAVAGNTLRVGAINAASTDITPASGWTASANIRRCLAMFGDVLLALQSGGGLFESTASAQAIAVTNAPTQSTVMLVTPSRQVMVLGTKEEISTTFNPRCIRWSDIEDRTDWTTSATNNAGEYILPGQEDIIAATVLGDYILVWTEGSLWLAQFTGDPSQTFTFDRVGEGGICGLDAFAVLRQTVYWIGPDFAVYSYSIGGGIQRLPFPFGTTAFTTLSQIFACSNSAYGEVWFCFPISGDSDATRYKVLCVDETAAAQRPVWFEGSFNTALGTGLKAGAMIDSPIGWDSAGAYRTQIILHQYNGTPKPWRWDCHGTVFGVAGSSITSTAFYFDESERAMMIRSFIPGWTTSSNVTMTIGTQQRPNSSGTVKGPYTITSNKKDFRASGKIMSASFTLVSATAMRFGKCLFDVVPTGER